MEQTSGRRARGRLILLIPAGIVLLIGLDAGLQLMGVPVPPLGAQTADQHAALMVFGFVGTLISLERAVALRAWWAYAAPGLLAAGALLSLFALPAPVGPLLILAGMAVHAGQYVAIWRRQPATAVAVQAIGAVGGLLAALVWTAGVPTSGLVPLLAMFPVLTIAGERLELSRVAAPGRPAERLLAGIALAAAVAALLCLTSPTVWTPLTGVILLALVAWLLRWDVARATVRATGLPRYVAVCLLAGYAWLAFAGAGWVLGGARTEGPVYDAVTHAIFLGFVISMIMGHAPIILPAVVGARLPYHPALYAPVAVLHLALLVRVVGGDAWGSVAALRAGGIGAALAIVLFAATAITVGVRAGRAADERSASRVSS